jgi:diguanylate cyclase (GGDEF)-like protein
LILFVLSIAILNFGVGYALAVLLSDAPIISPQVMHRQKAVANGPREIPTVVTLSATLGDIPPPWFDQLLAAELSPRDFFEAILFKLWTEITPLREELLTGEVRARLAIGRLDQTADAQLLNDVKGWYTRRRRMLDEVYAVLLPRLDLLEADQPAAEYLDQQLEQQLTRLDRTATELAAIEIEKEPELAARQLLSVLRDWLDKLHRHRDCVQALMAAKLRGCELIGLGKPLYLDPLTGQISRLGTENLFELWFQEDAQRLRLASCALVDIDRCARINDRLGHRVGDRFLSTIGDLLAAGIRNDRGFDRLARFSGQQFLIFLGDTGPQNAAGALERIRQSLEATTLDFEGNEHDVTISVGVVGIRREDTLEQLFERLQQALRCAKTHGRNRTAVDDGDGPEALLDPQRFAVSANHVRIGAT